MSEAARPQLPMYRCHKEVRAVKILEIRQSPATPVVEGGSWEIVPEDLRYGPIAVAHEFIIRHKPKPGGYLVVYKDGYSSYSPAKAFEEGYTQITENGGRLTPREIVDFVYPKPKPSIGRIVIYKHPGSADGKYPPQESPAIIQHVNDDGSCRLWVFGPKGLHTDNGLTEGDGPCQWHWPERI